MGTILSTKAKKEGGVIFEVLLDYEEALQLQGHIKKVHLFSEDLCDIPSNVSLRGKNESTKYFLIPKSLRNNLQFRSDVTCQKMETPSKVIFIYAVDKLEL